MTVSLLYFIALEINKLYRKVCILYRHVCILYIQYIYTLQVHMSTSGIVIQYLGSSCQSHNPKEIHCFKWGICVQFSHFNLCQAFQEYKPGIKHDLPVY